MTANPLEWVNTAEPEFSPTASVWLRIPHPLCAFVPLPIFPPTIVVWLVSGSTFPYFLFLLHSLQFPVLSVLSRTSRPKLLLSMPAPVPSSSVLPFTPLYSFLPCTSFSSCISSFRTSLLTRTSHICPALSLPKSS